MNIAHTRIIVSFGFFLCSLNAQSTVLANKPNDSLWVQTVEETQNSIGPLPVGNSTNLNPSWGIGQWKSPVPFTYPYSTHPYGNFVKSGQNWSLSNSASAVSYDITTQPWLGGVYQLSQNGKSGGGSPGLACDKEYDLFLAPKSNSNSILPFAANSPYGLNESQPISTLTGIWFNLGLNVLYEEQGNNCQDNAVAYTLGIMIKNTQTNRISFYQVIFRDSRGSIYNREVFIDKFGSTVVNDSINVINSSLSQPKPGLGRVGYSVSIFNRLKQAIQNNIYHSDPNLDHYKIVGTYFGNMLWGGSVTTSQWDNFSLIVAP